VAPTAKALAPAAGAPEGKTTGKTSDPSKDSCTSSGKRASSEHRITVEDVPESSANRNKKSRATPLGTKKVSVKEDGTGGAFTISSTLDDK